MKEKILKLGEKAPLLFGVLSFVALKIALRIPTSSFLQAGLVRILFFVIIFLILWPVFQNKHMNFPGTGWKLSFKLARAVLIFAIALSCIIVCIFTFVSLSPEISNELNSSLQEGFPKIRADWPLQLLYLILMAIGVGMVEEITFRRGIFLCLTKQIAGTNKALVISAIVSSIFFGYVHVSASFTSDKFELACSILKTIETGLFGFIMCAAFYESQNIWPVAAIHAINDGVLFLIILWNDNSTLGTYAYGSNNPKMAIASLCMYTVCSIIYLPSVIKSFKLLKETNDTMNLN